ncbi:MAG: carboxypeptidase-like regulatory domain-containing protein [Bacteroidota bacterium]|jgi:hypothetical protein
MKTKSEKNFYYLISILLITFGLAKSQDKISSMKKDSLPEYIQFSGVILSSNDSLKPIPLTSVIIKGTKRGAISDYFGFFTLVAQPGDVIQFVSLGYKEAQYKIPDTLRSISYSIIQTLFKDTFNLNEVTIYPWPTKEEFKREFLNLKLPEDDYIRAEKNMQAEEMRVLMKGLSNDPNISYKYLQNYQQTKLYNTGQMPVSNLLNPIAWAKFIQNWKSGVYSNKKKTNKN